MVSEHIRLNITRMKLLLSCVYAWDFYFVIIMVCNDLIVCGLEMWAFTVIDFGGF